MAALIKKVKYKGDMQNTPDPIFFIKTTPKDEMKSDLLFEHFTS